ncbi:hypothetical protein INT45_013182 [Circinella minor]|uniref:Uncharacterized protein n=1 Tax=Circinella minor TaxID=1195481 RepID=A0A8H7VJ71_9FUNG|nr:hypothetical protein INT45_013182 [Circinella minor]
MYASLIGTDGGLSCPALFDHQQLQPQSQRPNYHNPFEDSVIMNRYHHNFLYGQQVPLYTDHSSVQHESWRQQQHQSIPTTTIQANDSNKYGTMVPNVAHLTSSGGLHHGSTFNTNEYISKDNRLFGGHDRNAVVAYAETCVAFQNNQQQHQQRK